MSPYKDGTPTLMEQFDDADAFGEQLDASTAYGADEETATEIARLRAQLAALQGEVEQERLGAEAARDSHARMARGVKAALGLEHWPTFSGPFAEKVGALVAERLHAAEAEVERLRGVRPKFPPMPPDGEGLPRYGLRWNGPSTPVATPMDDGYWTPWHLAAARVETLEVALLEIAAPDRVYATLEEVDTDLIDCAECHGTFSMEDGAEPCPECHGCSTNLLEKARMIARRVLHMEGK